MWLGKNFYARKVIKFKINNEIYIKVMMDKFLQTS